MSRSASEDVAIQLVTHKCLPILIYGNRVYPWNKPDLNSFDFVINLFRVKLFKTNNINIIEECRVICSATLPSLLITRKIIVNLSRNLNLQIISSVGLIKIYLIGSSVSLDFCISLLYIMFFVINSCMHLIVCLFIYQCFFGELSFINKYMFVFKTN